MNPHHLPLKGGAVSLRAALCPVFGGLGQHPADDADVFRVKGMSQHTFQPFVGQAVEIRVNVVLVEFVQRIVAPAEPHQGRVKCRPRQQFHTVVGGIGHIFFDPLADKLIRHFHS